MAIDSTQNDVAVERVSADLARLYPHEHPRYLQDTAKRLVAEFGPDIPRLSDGDVETIYIAPGGNQCRVYAIPYLMRHGQSPKDINPAFRDKWLEIGLLSRNNTHLACLEPAYRHLNDDLVGMMGGTFFISMKTAEVGETNEVRPRMRG